MRKIHCLIGPLFVCDKPHFSPHVGKVGCKTTDGLIDFLPLLLPVATIALLQHEHTLTHFQASTGTDAQRRVDKAVPPSQIMILSSVFITAIVIILPCPDVTLTQNYPENAVNIAIVGLSA